jgi:uncharacterized protein
MTWSLEQLESVLSEQAELVVTRETDCLLIANSDGLDAWLALSGEQILVESLLFSVAEVKDPHALNQLILRTYHLFPLTTIGISTIGDTEYYVAFGALSAQSDDDTILIEINTLFQNVEAFLDAYQDQLK